ncbi:MAG: signal peptidase I [Deltaproteobacteria bacterium]|nr:signal peptidase I [Deltaproteobacteria bacterium]
MTNETPTKHAAILSFLVPGLGQLYSGHATVGGVFVVLYLVLAALGLNLALAGPGGMLMALLMTLSCRIASSIHAARATVRRGDNLKGYQKGWSLVVTAGVAVIFVLMGVPGARSGSSFKIPSPSMHPALMLGDRIFVDLGAYLEKEPARGDVIIYRTSRGMNETFMKRVIGLPGDRVAIRSKVVFINGKELVRRKLSAASCQMDRAGSVNAYGPRECFEEQLDGKTYVVVVDSKKETTSDFKEVLVPEQALFVLGDNRDYSTDSRQWGFVEQDEIRGKVLYVWMNLWLDLVHGNYYFDVSRIGQRL